MEPTEAQIAKLYSSSLIDTHLRYLRKCYPNIDTEVLLRQAGIKLYEVTDPGHWFDGEQVDRFHQAMVEATGSKDVAMDAGRFAASSEALGLLPNYVQGLLDPGNALALLERVAPNWTRAARYRSESVARNQALITVTPAPGVKETPFICESRIGFFESVPKLFNCRLHKIEHSHCACRGDDSCRYLVSWRRPSDAWRTARNSAVFLMGVLLTAAFWKDPHFALLTVLPVAISLSLLITMIYEAAFRKELNFNLENFRASADQLLEQVQSNYNNTMLASEIGQAISRQTHTDDILADVVKLLKKRLHYGRGMILLTGPDRKALTFRAGFGYSEEQLDWLRKIDFHLDRPESQGIFVVAFRKKKPFLIRDLDQIEGDLSSRSLLLAQKLGVKSFICCPILSDGDSVGILAVDNQSTHRPLRQSDLSLLMGIATFIGISLHNADLLEGTHMQSRSIMRILASSIDARDPLTAGHSEKVTEYALGICEELDLPQQFRDMVRVAGLLHDYGKIGVPDAILKKEGRLNEEEYAIVQTHAEKTREILEQINFKGVFRQVPEVAAAHHEKIDGSGYPRGLKGKDIPLGSKIIAVADYFDAITSMRHYRQPMDAEQAFTLLQEGSGKGFEPRIVEAFTRYYRRVHSPTDTDSSRPHRPRRKRIEFRTQVTLKVNGLRMQGISADLSTRGIFVATREEASQGTPVEVSFALPGKGLSHIKARGRIAWVNSRREMKKPVFPMGFGVEFVELHKDSSKILQEFLGFGQTTSAFGAASW